MEAFSISSRQEFAYSITEIEERIRDIDEEYGHIRSFDDVNKHEMELSRLKLGNGSSIFLDYGEWYIYNAKTIKRKYPFNELRNSKLEYSETYNILAYARNKYYC